MKNFKRLLLAIVGSIVVVGSANADQVILDDLIVDGSACIGLDCVNGESFGFDTLRLKENNLRIRAFDTSSSASFPSNDWQITFNDTSNGGANKFSIDDIDGGRTPFTIEAGAPSHSLYVDDGGRIGLGTATPVVEIHVKDGDTPTIRLEQDGSSGFTPQTWDMASNETNYFIRDVSNGSKLPFRIRPGAKTSAIDVNAVGDVGFGTTSPLASHITVLGSATTAGLKLCTVSGDCNTTGAGNGANFTLFNNTLFITNREAGNIAFVTNNAATSQLVIAQSGEHTMNGNLTITGDITVTGQCTEVDGACAPDYVFEQDYDLLPLAEVAEFIEVNKHLPDVPKGSSLDSKGINIHKFSYTLLQKIEELTLYTLKQEETIKQLQADMKELANK